MKKKLLFNIDEPDFRTKFFMTLTLSYTLLLGNLQTKYLPIAIIASILPYVFLFLSRKYKESIKGIVMILCVALIQKHLLYNAKGILLSILLFFCMLFLRMLPGLMMGKYTFINDSLRMYKNDEIKMYTLNQKNMIIILR